MEQSASQIEFVITEGDVLSFEADVVALKYAEGFHGVDEAVADRFQEAGLSVNALKVPKGNAKFVSAQGAITAENILMVGVGSLYQFRYREIREFAHAPSGRWRKPHRRCVIAL